MNKRSFTQKLTDFLNGRGFYIALALCVTAIGVSGWYLWRGFTIASDLAEETGRSQAVTVVPEEEAEETTLPAQTDPADSEPLPDEEEAPAAEEAEQMAAEESSGAADSAAETMAPASEASQDAETSEADEEASSESTGEAAEPAEDAIAEEKPEWVWPSEGAVVAAFSADTLTYNSALGDWRTHNGVDLAAKLGDEVSAAHAGKVVSVGEDHLLGRTVVIDCGEGLKAVYGNLSDQISVAVGDRVAAGDVIATVGDTAAGEANEGAWLHFSVEKDGTAVDPATYLD